MAKEIEVDITNGERLYVETKELGEISIKEVNGEVRISIEGNLLILPNGANAINLINKCRIE